jgi:hypothetical protein
MATPGRYDTPAGNLSFTPWQRTLGRRYLCAPGAGGRDRFDLAAVDLLDAFREELGDETQPLRQGHSER